MDALQVQCTLHTSPILSPTKLYTGLSHTCSIFGATCVPLAQLLMPRTELSRYFLRPDVGTGPTYEHPFVLSEK